MLFALVAVRSTQTRAQACSWASKVLAQAPAGSQRLEDWKPPDLVEWKPVGTQPAAIYQPVRDGFTKLPWTKVDMDRVGMAIQLWFGNAQYDGLVTVKYNLEGRIG